MIDLDFHIGNFMQIMQISWALLGLASPRYFACKNVKQRVKHYYSSIFSMPDSNVVTVIFLDIGR
jgi:hypothetical protein